MLPFEDTLIDILKEISYQFIIGNASVCFCYPYKLYHIKEHKLKDTILSRYSRSSYSIGKTKICKEYQKVVLFK